MKVSHHQHAETGFTLIELMIVVAIIGIIAAVAYPSYQENIRNTQRATAQADLQELAQWMERRFSVNNTYLNGAAAPVLPFTKSPRSGAGAIMYEYTFNPAPATNSFTLRATPKGSQVADSCGTMTLTHLGLRGAAVAGCW